MIGSFHLPLHPGGISRGNLWLESVMQCKSRQGVVELVLAGELADENVLHPVVENLRRHTAKMLEGVNMTIQKGR